MGGKMTTYPHYFVLAHNGHALAMQWQHLAHVGRNCIGNIHASTTLCATHTEVP